MGLSSLMSKTKKHQQKSVTEAIEGGVENESVYRAVANGTVIAQADKSKCQIVEGNVYMPPGSLIQDFLRESSHTSHCGWKGHCTHQDVVLPDGKVFSNAIWTYSDPFPAATNIKGHFAFWNGVKVQ